MRKILTSDKVDIPEGVEVTVKSRVVTVKGPKGEPLVRSFKHQFVDFQLVNPRLLKVELWFGTTKQSAVVRTICSTIKNLIIGVTQGYRYKMRLVYAHFPINITLDEKEGKWIEIRNFLGEKRLRRVEALQGVTIKRSDDVKDQLEIEGSDVNNVSLTCALIQQICHVRHKDIRKFLDGIYVSHSGAIPVDA